MAQCLVLRVLLAFLALAVIVGTTSDQLAVSRFREAIKIQTISTDSGPQDPAKFLQFIQFIKSSFPTIHNSPLVDTEVVNNYSLLYHVHGSNSSLQPYLLTAHYDVVPADATKWIFHPFEGVLKDGFVYGRGTLDVKCQLMALLESVETKLSEGFKPRRGFYMALGHDEENGGYNGAKQIGILLEKRGVKVKFLLDEGTAILQTDPSSVKAPVALISVAEKGYASFRLTANGTSGHSSTPSRNTSIVKLARAILRLEDNPHPIKLDSGLEKFLVEALSPQFAKCFDTVFDNKDLFSPTLSLMADQNNIVNAVLRTTTAVTIVQGGVKINIIPDSSSAFVDHRVYPTDTVKGVLEYDQKVVNDPSVRFEIVDQAEPSPISPYGDTAFGFQVIKKSILELLPNITAIPGLTIGATDTKWYRNLTDQVYHFSPYIATLEDFATVHGDNERISVENFERLINFYHHLILNADKESHDVLTSGGKAPTVAPTDVTCTTLTSQIIHVTWSALDPHVVDGVLRGYKVLYRPASDWLGGSGEDDPTDNSKITLSTSTNLAKLDKFANYSIQVLAVTKAGNGPTSQAVFCQTQEDVPGSPSDIKAIQTSEDSVIVSWKKPDNSNGVIKSYTVYWRNVDNANAQEAASHRVAAGVESCEVTQLIKEQIYEFWVTASTVVGEGQASIRVTQTPNGQSSPPAAPVVHVTSITFDSVEVQWKTQTGKLNKVKGYSIHLRNYGGEWSEVDIGAEVHSYLVTGLYCGTRYELYMTAHYATGVGASSSIQIFNTNGSAPTSPTDSELIEPASNSVSLDLNSWKSNGCPIQYYVVEYTPKSGNQWILVSNSVRPERRRVVITDLAPATWYTLRMTAHNSAGSTVARYDFATL